MKYPQSSERAAEPMELELQALCGCWELILGRLEGHPVLLVAEMSLHCDRMLDKKYHKRHNKSRPDDLSFES